jgi:hypothetical protein
MGIQQVQSFCGSCSTTPSVVTNNLVWNNGTDYDGVQIFGIGSTVTTNGNGDPVDSYFNLSQDPLFLSNTPPALSPSSPCMGAGSASISSNVGANVNTLCKGMVTSIPKYQNLTSTIIFPNPFHDSFSLTVPSSLEISSIGLRDICGREIKIVKLQRSGSNEIIDASTIANGSYILEVRFTNGAVQHQHLVKKE